MTVRWSSEGGGLGKKNLANALEAEFFLYPCVRWTVVWWGPQRAGGEHPVAGDHLANRQLVPGQREVPGGPPVGHHRTSHPPRGMGKRVWRRGGSK